VFPPSPGPASYLRLCLPPFSFFVTDFPWEAKPLPPSLVREGSPRWTPFSKCWHDLPPSHPVIDIASIFQHSQEDVRSNPRNESDSSNPKTPHNHKNSHTTHFPAGPNFFLFPWGWSGCFMTVHILEHFFYSLLKLNLTLLL